MNPRGRIGISWSVNPQEIVHEEEKGASSLKARLTAAADCQERGYLVGFHFDPIIFCSDWDKKYREVVDMIFTALDPVKITWISLGGFRYPAFLKPVIRERFPESRILLGELFPGPDGKYRYLRRLRTEMYRTIVARIKHYDPHAFIYLCMESQEMWDAVFGQHPSSRDELDHQFAERIRYLWSER
jgi:spore photoproduct lyase